MNLVTKFFPKSNSLPIDKFIYNALYKKNLGYYAKKNPIGKKGDFITAPEISFLFSEMIAVWVISLWEHLGKPKDFNIVELIDVQTTLIIVFNFFDVVFEALQGA